MAVPPAYDLQGLLDQDQWIRRLARKLAGDAHAAEDLVQDTWVAALGVRGSTPRPRAMRPWLRGILRNLWIDARRSGAARADRERAAARDDALEPASELVAELELRKSVAEALLALEEPWRRALYMRFFRDQSLGAIARREGISVTTAHERIQQGLARLRARLDRAHRGRREAWGAGPLSLARPAAWWTATAEAAAMAGGLKLAASVLVIGGGVAWLWMERGSHPERAVAVDAAREEAEEVSPPRGLEPVSARGERFELAASADAAPAPSASSEPAALLVRGRVVDLSGAPVANVTVGWSDEHGASARSGSDGSFVLEDADHAKDAEVRERDPDLVTLVPGERGAVGRPESWLVVVAPRASFAGIVVDPAGAPVAGARVTFGLREALFRELGLHRQAFEGSNGRALTAADGSFELADVAGGERVFLQVEAEGFWLALADLPEVSSSDLVIRLERHARSLTVTGVVLEHGGAAAAGARVSAGDGIVTCDAHGRFELAVGERHGTFGPLVGEAAQEHDLAGAVLVALQAGSLPARVPLEELDLARPVVLQLGARAETIRGRVLDGEHRPRAGVVLWARDPTPFGREIQAVAEGTTVAWTQTIEDELVGGFGHRGALSDERGGFELGGLLTRSYEVMAFVPETAELDGPWTILAGSRDAELVLARETRRGHVAGRILSARREPLAGVVVSARRTFEGTDAHAQPPWLRRHTATTDDDGRFELGEVALERTQLVLEDRRFLLRTVDLAPFDDPAHLELVEPVLCELQVELTGEPLLADTVKVLDGEGRELETLESFDNGWSAGTEAQFRDGLTSVLSIKETAETLVLLRKGIEVLRRPLRLDPAGRTVVRQ